MLQSNRHNFKCYLVDGTFFRSIIRREAYADGTDRAVALPPQHKAKAYTTQPYRLELKKKFYRTLSLLCEDESLSDSQLKAYQTRLQDYRTYLEAVSRLASCGNVCITEETVMIGENGLLTGEALNALQHAGAISVYNTLQQNNWEFPVPEEGEVAIVKSHTSVPDEFLDSEKPIRADWPAIHVSECFIEGEKAKLHGSVRPLKTFIPPTVVFRNAADVDEDTSEPDHPISHSTDAGLEIVATQKGLVVKKTKRDGKSVDYIPIDEYYFGIEEGYPEYKEEKAEFRFKCAVCQRMFYSNMKLMHHILGHVDELLQTALHFGDVNQCRVCHQLFSTSFDLRSHVHQEHPFANTTMLLGSPDGTGSGSVGLGTSANGFNGLVSEGESLPTASQLLMQQQLRGVDPSMGIAGGQPSIAAETLLAGRLHLECEVGEVPPEVASSDGFNETVNQMAIAATTCRICGKDTPSELALAHHFQSTHRQREMPYVCRLCNFRSSIYEELITHFKKGHGNSNHLLCTYCLRIFTPTDARGLPSSSSPANASLPGGGVSTAGLGAGVGQTQVYLQHLRMHQVRHQIRRCPFCRLTFINKSDYQVHRKLDHKAGSSVSAHSAISSTVVTTATPTGASNLPLLTATPSISGAPMETVEEPVAEVLDLPVVDLQIDQINVRI
ncbi:unnamed protein product [Protopolystoma xenopodis]|uniref:C2H2-type domain-containing protein n=1 Tax=Protopolystoma xenopodis TaxID=117903 RepID=A0A3S5B246_9PLAT|nr:unnamed protein product [Protopolystoma xenopodis]